MTSTEIHVSSATGAQHRASGRIVWIARSSAGLASDIAERLRGLDVDVKLWDDSGAHSGPRRATAAVSGTSIEGGARPVWRGGLAPGALRRVRDHIEQALANT